MTGRESARRFHFLREIASGGFGSVYLCKVVHADGFSRLAAVKLLKTQWTDNEEVVHRIRDEARLLGLLRHRNIVDVMDLTSIDGRTAVVMEYLEAVDFRTVTRSLQAQDSRIPAKAALEGMAAVAGALDAAYNRPPIPGDKPLRVIHRDIKPSNIMIDETGMVKVLDFGVARSEIDGRESHTRELQFGSVDYMAPERLFFEPETPASDVYSLSATLYEILALEKLGKARGSPEKHATHLADRLSFLRAQLSLTGASAIELEALLRSGLAFEHEERPSAAAFFQRARALSRLMEGEDLSSWAERTLPALIQEGQDAPQEASPLTQAVLTEDSQAFGGEPEPPPDPSLAAAVQRGALAELGNSNSDAARLLQRPLDVADDVDEWEDVPTRVTDEAQAAASKSLAPAPVSRDPIDEARAALLNAAPPEPVLAEEDPLATDEQPTMPYVAGRTIVPDDDTYDEFFGEATTPRHPFLTTPVPEPAASAQIISPAPAPEPAPEPPPAKQSRMMVIVAGLVLGCAVPIGLLGLGGIALALDVGGIRTALAPSEAVVVPDELDDFDAPTPEAVPPEPQPLEASGGIVFTSADPRTEKLKVRCGAESGSGTLSARVGVASAEKCMITAYPERLRVVIEGATEGQYTCFVDGEEACTRE